MKKLLIVLSILASLPSIAAKVIHHETCEIKKFYLKGIHLQASNYNADNEELVENILKKKGYDVRLDSTTKTEHFTYDDQTLNDGIELNIHLEGKQYQQQMDPCMNASSKFTHKLCTTLEDGIWKFDLYYRELFMGVKGGHTKVIQYKTNSAGKAIVIKDDEFDTLDGDQEEESIEAISLVPKCIIK